MRLPGSVCEDFVEKAVRQARWLETEMTSPVR
jgi:hypothetical protein